MFDAQVVLGSPEHYVCRVLSARVQQFSSFPENNNIYTTDNNIITKEIKIRGKHKHFVNRQQQWQRQQQLHRTFNTFSTFFDSESGRKAKKQILSQRRMHCTLCEQSDSFISTNRSRNRKKKLLVLTNVFILISNLILFSLSLAASNLLPNSHFETTEHRLFDQRSNQNQLCIYL